MDITVSGKNYENSFILKWATECAASHNAVRLQFQPKKKKNFIK